MYSCSWESTCARFLTFAFVSLALSTFWYFLSYSSITIKLHCYQKPSLQHFQWSLVMVNCVFQAESQCWNRVPRNPHELHVNTGRLSVYELSERCITKTLSLSPAWAMTDLLVNSSPAECHASITQGHITGAFIYLICPLNSRKTQLNWTHTQLFSEMWDLWS